MAASFKIIDALKAAIWSKTFGHDILPCRRSRQFVEGVKPLNHTVRGSRRDFRLSRS
jgi:hypothetical protein